jgi:serine/threonine-protein kinase
MIIAHARNLVHRDLKPANLFLVHDEHGIPIVKVLDFGISKLRANDDLSLSLTEANGVMGSPSYMSPEQIRSARDVDARADIWSLGTILYELLTGAPPFQGSTLGGVFYAIAREQPRPMAEVRPEVTEELDGVVARCLEKDPELRYQQAQELQQALLPFASARLQAKLSMRPGSGTPPAKRSSAPPIVATSTLPQSRTTGGWSHVSLRAAGSRKLPGALVLAGFCVAAAVAAALFALRGRVQETAGPHDSIRQAGVSAASPTSTSPRSGPAPAAASPSSAANDPVPGAAPRNGSLGSHDETGSEPPSPANRRPTRAPPAVGAKPAAAIVKEPGATPRASAAAPTPVHSTTPKNPLDMSFK